MADNNRRSHQEGEDQTGQSIFDLFEPPPDPDPNHFGKIPAVRDAEPEVAAPPAVDAERQAAAEAEAAGLQHWTAPATGQVPAVLGSEADGWENQIKGPSWHGDDPSWTGPDLSDVFADEAGVAPHSSRPSPGRRPAAPAPAASGPNVTRLPRPERPGEPAPRPNPAAPPPLSGAGVARSPEPQPRGEGLERGVQAAYEPEPAAQPASVLQSTGPQPQVPSSPALMTPATAGRAYDDRYDTPPAVEEEGRSVFTERPGGHDLAYEGDGHDQAGYAQTGYDQAGYDHDGYAQAGHDQVGYDQADYEDEYYYYDDEEEDIGLGPAGGRDIPRAIMAAAALVAVLGLALFLGPLATLILILGLAFLAALELSNAMRLAGLRPATLLAIVGTVAVPAAAYYRGDTGYPLVVGLLVVFGFLWYLIGADNERPVLNLSLTMMSILWVGGLASFAALMIKQSYGLEILASTITITVASDTMAYIGGRAFGSRPFHAASPKKTWEGTLFGLAAAVFAGAAIGVLPFGEAFQRNFTGAILLGLVVGVLAPIGDLAESLVKRDLGIKDMGTILPGHGGILDRIDGLLFALPGAYYLSLIYGLFGS